MGFALIAINYYVNRVMLLKKNSTDLQIEQCLRCKGSVIRSIWYVTIFMVMTAKINNGTSTCQSSWVYGYNRVKPTN